MTDILKELDEVMANYVTDKWLLEILDDKVARERLVAYLYHHAHEIRAALELKTRVDSGWVLVPREPTYQMAEAIGVKWESGEGFPARYRAMLNAAPPEGEGEDTKNQGLS